EAIRVATWNIKFAGARIRFFWECPGDRETMSESEVRANLEPIAAAIDEIDADVLLIQEIDVDAKRTAYIDQVQWLLDHTDYNYGAYASEQRSAGVPGGAIDRTNSGNAVLSKWPITAARRIALPKIEEQSALTQYFYPRRNILDTRIRVPEHSDFRVLATHTSAFAEDDTARRQIAQFADRFRTHDAADELVVAGGDLNTLPPGSEKRKNFEPKPDHDCEQKGSVYTDHVGWMDPMYEAATPAVGLEDYRTNNTPYFTYTGEADGFWNRKLDYLFTNGIFTEGSTTTYQNKMRGGIETLPLSDHAPISVELVLPASPP
ncbi:MAG: endonuclease/exonuclease/phosphatase family protein, partial [Bradymonadaceae bacterium]